MRFLVRWERFHVVPEWLRHNMECLRLNMEWFHEFTEWLRLYLHLLSGCMEWLRHNTECFRHNREQLNGIAGHLRHIVERTMLSMSRSTLCRRCCVITLRRCGEREKAESKKRGLFNYNKP